jgi:hypothetical protein
MVGSKTYAMQGLTSVVMSKTRTTPGGPQIGCGILLALAAAVAFGEKSTTGPAPWVQGLALLAVAAILVGGGLWQNRRQLVTFSVTLTTASGEQTAFSSTDEALVRTIVERLNEAIANRD